MMTDHNVSLASETTNGSAASRGDRCARLVGDGHGLEGDLSHGTVEECVAGEVCYAGVAQGGRELA